MVWKGTTEIFFWSARLWTTAMCHLDSSTGTRTNGCLEQIHTGVIGRDVFEMWSSSWDLDKWFQIKGAYCMLHLYSFCGCNLSLSSKDHLGVHKYWHLSQFHDIKSWLLSWNCNHMLLPCFQLLWLAFWYHGLLLFIPCYFFPWGAQWDNKMIDAIQGLTYFSKFVEDCQNYCEGMWKNSDRQFKGRKKAPGFYLFQSWNTLGHDHKDTTHEC